MCCKRCGPAFAGTATNFEKTSKGQFPGKYLPQLEKVKLHYQSPSIKTVLTQDMEQVNKTFEQIEKTRATVQTLQVLILQKTLKLSGVYYF
jgi:hypothetical protein